MKAYVNGSLVEANVAVLPIDDRGLLYGDGLFETVPVYGSRACFLDAHIARLQDGGRALRFARLQSASEISSAVQAVLEAAAPVEEGVLRIMLTRGRLGSEGLACNGLQTPTLVVTVGPPRRYNIARYLEGITMAVGTLRHLRPSQLPTAFKHANYLSSILAFDDARAAGADDALMLDEDGGVVEASFSNVFAVSGRRVITPPLTDGALAGITRAKVLAVAARRGFKVEESRLHVTSLDRFDEVFLTSSLAGVVPVRRVGSLEVPHSPGSVTRTLFAGYWRLVREQAGPPWSEIQQVEREFSCKP